MKSQSARTKVVFIAVCAGVGIVGLAFLGVVNSACGVSGAGERVEAPVVQAKGAP